MTNIFIAGTNINLVPIEEHHLEGNYPYWFNDQDVTRYMVKGAFPNTKKSQYNFYETVIGDRSNLILAIMAKKPEMHIGVVGLHNINAIHRNAELGICIGEKSFWGKGLGTEAVRLICKHGFEQVNLRRVELGVLEENTYAIRSYESLGFKREGVKREHFYKNGKYVNVILMSLLKREFCFANGC